MEILLQAEQLEEAPLFEDMDNNYRKLIKNSQLLKEDQWGKTCGKFYGVSPADYENCTTSAKLDFEERMK